ncbi:ADP-ribosyl cyclase/cyclic ADP-ribose hydrolase-like [Anneissia japonica]|uniref:ADP-ribosyl cyclase/cyclic ADP-ribose hydrolase-like n=1 Tax=Anneissia japonica TaxID=1529436 RepID=UPI0014255138|nr:ADP-ribosyl cyclase/cyclic ADP-ribose hydrolase-like [Anneissia japonica]
MAAIFLMPIFASLLLVVCATGTGTTMNILEILEGRCHEYIQCIKPVNSNFYCGPALRPSFNCTSLINTFTTEVTYHEPCSLGPDAFDDFVDEGKQDLPPDMQLFWSGPFKIAHEYALFTERKSLEDSLIGYMMNGVTFCGSTESPGFNFDMCPICSNSTSSIFWNKASMSFARTAKGKVEVVLSASNFGRPSFRNGSVFREIEVPNLQTGAVSQLTAILVRDIGDNTTTSEHCGTGSLLELKNIIEARNITFYCEENPDRIRAIQCAEQPEADECLALFNSGYMPIITPTMALFLLAVSILNT